MSKIKRDLIQLGIIWALAISAGIFCFWYINHSVEQTVYNSDTSTNQK